MGGRGSAFRITTGRTNENWFQNYYNEKYTNLPTKDTDYLKDNKDTWVMETTDSINREVMNGQSKFIKNLSKTYSGSTQLLSDTNNLRIRALKLKSSSTYAAFVFPMDKYEKMQICFNTNKINVSKQQLENKTKAQIACGFWSHSDDDNLANHTIAHEYGHFVERTIIEKMSKANPQERKQFLYHFDKYYNEKSKEIYKRIYEIKCNNFNDVDKQRVSRYANDCHAENFAEVFANLVTSKAPTNWGKAMKVYLEEQGIC